MKYLSVGEILLFHARIIDQTGGSHGVRDIHLLESIVGRPKMQFGGNELYPSVFDKAAAYFCSCAYHHVFVDGNKRTALAVASIFISLNGWELNASQKATEKFVLRAVEDKYDIPRVSVWFKNNSKKTSNAKK